jgi:hypothetical protein
VADGQREKAWAHTALEQFCRELPLKARRMEAMTPERAAETARRTVRALDELLKTIIEPSELD